MGKKTLSTNSNECAIKIFHDNETKLILYMLMCFSVNFLVVFMLLFACNLIRWNTSLLPWTCCVQLICAKLNLTASLKIAKRL